MNDKPPLEFLLHNLRSLIECIEEHYGYDVIDIHIDIKELGIGEEE